MKIRLTTLLAPALLAAGSIFTLPATGQVVATPTFGVPLAPVVQTPFFQGVPANASIPRVVPELSVPRPLQTDVNPNLREIRITFDQPMDTALFFWPIPQNEPSWSVVTNTPYWTNGNRTVVLPVVLAPGRVYAIPINTPNLVFRGATGLYVNPGLFRFETRSGSQGGSVSIGREPVVPAVVQTPIPVHPALVGRTARNSGANTASPAVIGNTPAQQSGANNGAQAMPNRQGAFQQRSGSSPALQRRQTPGAVQQR